VVLPTEPTDLLILRNCHIAGNQDHQTANS
jgi:hypothetical protein